MPELPEVETLARDLQRLLPGAAVDHAEVLWARSVAAPDAAGLIDQVAGREILSVGRRGKFVVLSLSGPLFLLIHLRMSGRLLVQPPGAAYDQHARAVVHLSDGRQLLFSDPRKFGRIYVTADLHAVTGGLGREPLDARFTLREFRSLLAGRRGALKPLLLRQDVLAGLGNIYADEVLFAAGLHPRRKADGLFPAEEQRLYRSIRTVLRRAIHNRGTTLPDSRYRDAEGRPGAHQERLCVYQRHGEPCVRCGTPIERSVIAQRGTHYCPNCQRETADCTG